MLDVHEKGRAVVSTGTREEMERDVEAMHGYGLWATLEKDA
jgi:ATP-dependent Clp protease adaptor protein ClpS